jgi:hypothetical protein
VSLRRALWLVIAFVLISAWQAALQHPLVHVDGHGAFVHIGGGHVPHIPGDKKAPNLQCDVLAAVAACVGSIPQTVLATLAGTDLPNARAMARLPGAPSLAYRSQAPPSLL